MKEFIRSFLSLIRTTDERDTARRGVARLEESLFRSFPREFNEVIRSEFSARTGEYLRDFFSKPSYLRNPDLIKTDLIAVLTALDAMRTLRLEVAIEANDVFIERVAGWALVNLGSDIVLEVVRDRTVVGGARIIFQGKYRKSTIVDMVQNVFEKKRDIVMKEFQS